jgi:hypothetical protein
MKNQGVIFLFFLSVLVPGLALWKTHEGATAEKISVPSNTWVRVKTTGDGSDSQYGSEGLPRFRGWQQASFDLETREVVIFGGSSSTYMSDTWTFNLNEKVWHIRRPHPDLKGPCRRDNHNLVYDPVGKLHWLFNGIAYPDQQPDCSRSATWVYDRSKNQWTKVSVSGDRNHRLAPGIAYNADRRTFLQFGGGAVNLSDTTVRFHIAERRWQLVPTNPSPPPRTNIEGGLVYDRAHQVFVLFGGKGSKGVLGDTWTFDPAAEKWQRKNPSVSPPARDVHAMVYDEAREKVILFGGRGRGKLNDTWIYDAGKDEWRELKNTGNPPALFHHSGVYDPSNDVIIIVDGKETLLFRYEPPSGTSTSSKPKGGFDTRSSTESKSEKPEEKMLSEAFARRLEMEKVMTKTVDRDPGGSLQPAFSDARGAGPAKTLDIPPRTWIARPLPVRGMGRLGLMKQLRLGDSEHRLTITDDRGAVALGEITATVAAGPSSSLIDIPAGQWTALSLPDIGKGISVSKHVTGEFNPNNKLLYFTGGDYSGSGGYMQSYRQETWSLSIADRFSSTDINAGWKLEFPYCGPTGGVQPYHPDFVGWTWDSTRNVFWMVPGTMVGSSSNCPNEPGPGFLGSSVMTFDPVTQKWAHHGPASKYKNHTWQSVYDAKTDTIIQFAYNGGNGHAEAGLYNTATKTWSYVGLGFNALRKNIKINNGYMAADFEGRAIYAIDPFQGRLHRYLIDSRKLEDLGAVPTGPTNTTNPQAGNLVWDSVNKVLMWALDPWRGFHAYNPPTRTWEALPTNSNLRGIKAYGRTLVFDPSQNVFILFGCNSDSCKPSAHYMFLFRYR